MFGSKPRGATQRPAATAATSKGPLVPAWLWTIFGILFGLSCLALLYLWQPWQPANRGPAPVTAASAPAATTDSGKPADFQFYDLLPKQQVTPIPTQTVPDVVPDDPTPVVVGSGNDAAPTSTSAKPGQAHYILQVNSFQTADEADKQRAAVLLAGLPADVRHTTGNDGSEWYRVVSGPFDSKNEALKAQRQLQDSGIDALVVEQSE
ncbi:SPOR domain-containing protein [Aquirhabdus sp.]|uniref:SPOR domain-containing protein n=1 Tax=Aquirhabdus sp. TaxID=2824160 RepID=UPI00396C4A9C